MTTMCQTLATNSHIPTTLSHSPWTRPTLDPMSSRLLFPLAAGESEEGQTYSATGQSSPGHPAAGASNSSTSKTVQLQRPMSFQLWDQPPQAAGL